MASGLSENLATLKQEFTTAPVEEISEAEVPTGPLDSVDTESSIVEFPAPMSSVVAPLHQPITEPLAAETLKGQLSTVFRRLMKCKKINFRMIKKICFSFVNTS